MENEKEIGEKQPNNSMQDMHVDQEMGSKEEKIVGGGGGGGEEKELLSKSARKTYKKKVRQTTVDVVNHASPVKEGRKRCLSEDEPTPMDGVKRNKVSTQVAEEATNENMEAGLPEQPCKNK